HHLFNTHGIAAGCAKWWQIEDLLVRGARSGWPGASARRKAAPATSTSGGKSPRVGGAPHYKLYEERGLRALARNTGEREEARQRGRIAFDLNQTLGHCIVGCDLPREQPYKHVHRGAEDRICLARLALPDIDRAIDNAHLNYLAIQMQLVDRCLVLRLLGAEECLDRQRHRPCAGRSYTIKRRGQPAASPPPQRQ